MGMFTVFSVNFCQQLTANLHMVSARAIEFNEKTKNWHVLLIESQWLMSSIQLMKADEAKYWRQVLERVVNVIKFLAERGLPFRGQDEKCGLCTNGYFMGLLELLTKYDTFLSSHIEKHGN